MKDFSHIPNNAGIYIFKGLNNTPIYIGKAINLRNRVRSYWNETSWRDRPKLAILVPQILDIETIITQNEKEALILEASLIYKHQPKYNVLLKDNKSFPWIGLTYGEDFPRIIPVRELKWAKRKYPKIKLFGPYTDSSNMYKTLQTAKQLFPLRKRPTPLFKDRPCLNYHLGQCLAACQALVSIEDYNLLLKEIELFLNGKHDDLIVRLKEKMYLASENLNYEQAAKCRDQIKILDKALESQRIIIDNPDCERDIIGFANDEKNLCLQIFKMRGGKLIGREAFNAELNELQTLAEAISSIIEQAYLIRQIEDIPKEIIIQNEVPNLIIDLSQSIVEEQTFEKKFNSLLSSLAKKNIQVNFPKRGDKKEQIELATFNANQQLQANSKQQTKALIVLESLQEILEIDKLPVNIDCFDISHLQGTEVVASCVRLKNGFPDKSKYRKIKLTIDQNNDFFSMKEAVFRRYQKQKDLPDLILIDGGKGQLSFALEAVRELNLNQIPLFSLAKKEEEIFNIDNERILLPKNSPALQVLQRARDEAHRFALTYNRQRRTKVLKASFIDDIVGVGAVLKANILNNFTVKELQAAPPQELQNKLKISAKRADKLWKNIQLKMK